MKPYQEFKMKNFPIHLLTLAMFAAVFTANAGIPEPGARLYGTVAINGVTVTAANSDYVIEARKTLTGPAIARYQMGSQANAGNFYSLMVQAEDSAPLVNTNNAVLGSTLYLVVRNASGDLDSKTLILSERGLSARVNFGAVDSDGDGMSDAFETQYFGSATGGNPNADPDHDGRPNYREFLQGTNPNVADGRHPADISPADDRITLKELTDYILAWKTGATWPIEPALSSTNIEDYVTRAGAIWKGGETYVFDNDPVTVAPLWWTNTPTASLLTATATKDKTKAAAKTPIKVDRTLSSTYAPNQSVPVTLNVIPSEETRAYAVVDAPPAGWTVRNLSHDGRWDAVNRKIKWGPFFDQTPRLLTYEAVPGPTSSGAASFAGRGSFDGVGQAASGPVQMFSAGSVPQPSLVFLPPSSVGLQAELHGQAGRRYQIESSSDLLNWAPGATMTLDALGRGVIPVNEGANVQFLRLRSAD